MTDFLAIHSELIAKILNRLLAGGLSQVELCSTEFVSDFADRVPTNNFENHFDDAMDWLKREGIIRNSGGYDGNHGGSCYASCCLTGHALSLLDQKIEALNGMSAKQALAESETPGTPASAYVKAGSFLGGVLGGVTKSLGGG